jgi:NAD(P)-dependent dehydrogenase (short-subunit alcohol dehydrogenase family)
LNILIVGANRGIGLELYKQYLNAGNNVYGTVRDRTYLKDTVSTNSNLYYLDLSQEESINQFISKINTDITYEIAIFNAAIKGDTGNDVSSFSYNNLPAYALDSTWRKTYALDSIWSHMRQLAGYENLP